MRLCRVLIQNEDVEGLSIHITFNNRARRLNAAQKSVEKEKNNNNSKVIP